MIKVRRLSDLIAPQFFTVHNNLKNTNDAYYWLKGGRGSTKSSFVSIEIILGIMSDPEANAVVLRKVANTMRESVFDQLLWAIDMLRVSHLWTESVSPLRITYYTGQCILFKGGDKPKKIKSTKLRIGYVKYLWFEETDEFNNFDEIRMINQSLVRGGNDIKVFYTYNPPKSQNNWTNKEVREQVLRKRTYVHHSTYKNVPIDWLGRQFVEEADYIKETNPQKYAHEYEGEVTGTGAEVFTNLQFREISDEEISTFDKTYCGVDFGFAADPLHFTQAYFDSARKKLIIYREIHQTRLKNVDAVEKIKKIIDTNEDRIIADSAEPRTISEFRELGLRITPAQKGPGSVDHGIKFLQDLNEIIIDRARCPNTAREFESYELDQDVNGNFKGSYPDRNNHSIDAIRYALEDVIKNKRVKLKTFKGGI